MNEMLTRRKAFQPLMMVGLVLTCPTTAETTETKYHSESSLVYAVEPNAIYEIVPAISDDRYLSFFPTSYINMTFCVKKDPECPSQCLLKYAGLRAYRIIVGENRNSYLVAKDGKFDQGTLICVERGLKPQPDKSDLWLLCHESDGYVKIRSFMNPECTMIMGTDASVRAEDPRRHNVLLWKDTANNTDLSFKWKLRRVS